MKKNHWIKIVSVVICSIAGLYLLALLLLSIPFTVPAYFKDFSEPLISVPDVRPDTCADALYILGGSEKSVNNHINTAINRYHSGATRRIIFFNSTAKEEYDPALGRNLTKNEWITKQLIKGGVPRNSIRIMPFREGLFGTLSEARTVSEYVKAKDYASIILVSSPGHTRRVSLCFGHYFKGKNISMYIEHSKDPFYFREMVLEFFKLQVYRVIIAIDGFLGKKGHNGWEVRQTLQLDQQLPSNSVGKSIAYN